jgi:hypothetical protein
VSDVSELPELLFGIYAITGGLVVVFLPIALMGYDILKTTESKVVATIFGALLWPLILTGILLWMLPRAPRYLGRGVRDIYRQFRPEKIKLPKAKVRKC